MIINSINNNRAKVAAKAKRIEEEITQARKVADTICSHAEKVLQFNKEAVYGIVYREMNTNTTHIKESSDRKWIEYDRYAWEEYQKQILDWNVLTTNRRAEVKVYFGEETYKIFYRVLKQIDESCSPIVVTVGCPPQTTIEGGLPMGLLIRDDRQMKALTGVSQAQFDFLLPAFSYVYQEPQQQRYEEGGKTGHRSRKPGAGIKGKLPTMADKLLFVLYYYMTYPTFDVLGTQFDMVRSKANENLHKRSPILYDTLVEFDLRPYRELETPEALRAALTGVDQLLIDATERTCRCSQDDATQREYYSGKKRPYAEEYGDVDAGQVDRLSGSHV